MEIAHGLPCEGRLPMNESQRLATQMKMALQGGAWHGPSWKEILEGVMAGDASRRPIPEAHSIAEVLHHASTWSDVVRRRLGGELPNVSNEENWPIIESLDEKAWTDARNLFFERGAALCETVAAFPSERLLEARPQPANGTWEDLILGQLQHLLYHGGQVALLQKAGTQQGQ
jgi:hypothetical protein